MDKALALCLVNNVIEDCDLKSLEAAAVTLATYSEADGLECEELEQIVKAITSEKLSSALCTKLMRCMIPKIEVPSDCVAQILYWCFDGLGKHGPSLERYCFRWFIGLLQYNLCEKSTIQSFYDNFFLAIFEHRHLETLACIILYYISGHDDAIPDVVKPLCHRFQQNPYPELGALLSLMHSFRPESITREIPNKPLTIPQSSFDKHFKSALNRMKEKNSETALNILSKPHYEPLPVYSRQVWRSQSHTGTIASLVRDTNGEGLRLIASASPTDQAHLLQNIEQTLTEMLLLNDDKYRYEEKRIYLLVIATLEENLQQSFSVVNRFLSKFLLIWNGRMFWKEILMLLNWYTPTSAKDWEMVLHALRINLRVADKEQVMDLFNALSNCQLNIVSTSIRDRKDLAIPLVINMPDTDPLTEQVDYSLWFSEVITEGLTWSQPLLSRIFLSAAHQLINKRLEAEEEGDMTSMLRLPCALVYHTLLSPNRRLIQNLSRIMLVQNNVTRERLQKHGVLSESDFAPYLNGALGTYIMDTYRALFADLLFAREVSPGIFSPDYTAVLQKHSTTDNGRVPLTKSLNHNVSFAWWDVNWPSIIKVNLPPDCHVMQLKTFVESML